MRFMVMVKADANSEAGELPDEKLLSEMGKYNDELVQAKMMLAGEGLKASAHGVRVGFGGKKFSVVDGPFAEAKELVAGFWLLQAKSKDELLEWLKRAPFKEGEIELRPLYEIEDFPQDPAEKAEGWREQEQRFREAADAKAPVVARKPGTTRYVMMIKGDKASESGALPSERVLSAMGELIEDMTKSGAMLAGEGLKPSSQGARVQFSGSKRTVIDGPFTEAKELVAGYCLIQVESKQAAIDFAKRWLEVHALSEYADGGVIEIRPLYELEDFPVDPAEKTDGWRAQEQRFRNGT